MPRRPIVVFDVNETLMNLETLSPTFERIFDDPAAMRLWFAHLITYSEALTLSGVYIPFTDIGSAVLRMLAATRAVAITDGDAAELTDRFASMPAHPEVPDALRRLDDHGFRLFTLTDNTLEISGHQFEHAGIIEFFERRFSVDETVEAPLARTRGLPLRGQRTRARPGAISAWSPATSGTPSEPALPAGRRRSSSGKAMLRSTLAPNQTTSAMTSTSSPTS